MTLFLIYDYFPEGKEIINATTSVDRWDHPLWIDVFSVVRSYNLTHCISCHQTVGRIDSGTELFLAGDSGYHQWIYSLGRGGAAHHLSTDIKSLPQESAPCPEILVGLNGPRKFSIADSRNVIVSVVTWQQFTST
jgi:hypothetical protein